MTLSWPLDNIGPSLTNLLATVAGNLFELRQVSGLRIERLRLPPAFAGRYSGPAFGVAGTRRLAGVAEGPLIGTIIKPSVGFTATGTNWSKEALSSHGRNVSFFVCVCGVRRSLAASVEPLLRQQSSQPVRLSRPFDHVFMICTVMRSRLGLTAIT